MVEIVVFCEFAIFEMAITFSRGEDRQSRAPRWIRENLGFQKTPFSRSGLIRIGQGPKYGGGGKGVSWHIYMCVYIYMYISHCNSCTPRDMAWGRNSIWIYRSVQGAPPGPRVGICIRVCSPPLRVWGSLGADLYKAVAQKFVSGNVPKMGENHCF